MLQRCGARSFSPPANDGPLCIAPPARLTGSLACLPVQGLLEKQPSLRLDWPQLLDHPFLAETAADKERQAREAALLSAQKAEAEAAPTLQSRVHSGAAAAAEGEAQVGMNVFDAAGCPCCQFASSWNTRSAALAFLCL